MSYLLAALQLLASQQGRSYLPLFNNSLAYPKEAATEGLGGRANPAPAEFNSTGDSQRQAAFFKNQKQLRSYCPFGGYLALLGKNKTKQNKTILRVME